MDTTYSTWPFSPTPTTISSMHRTREMAGLSVSTYGSARPTHPSTHLSYTVNVNICGNRGYQSTIPMPPIGMLCRPERITFHVRGSEIVVTPGLEGAPVRPPPTQEGPEEARLGVSR